MSTYYHVSQSYSSGALLCWNSLEAAELATTEDWKWAEAPVGSDGHLVSLWAEDQTDEVEWMMDEFGGHLLKITIPEDEITSDSELDWDDPTETRVYLTSITEGQTTNPAAWARIPAEYIEVVK